MTEVLVVVALILVVSAMSLFQITAALRNSRVNAGYSGLIGELRQARQFAIDNRSVIRLTLTAPRTVTIEQRNAGAATYTVLRTVPLNSDVQFAVVAGQPNTLATVPDGFGTGALALDFNGSNVIYFQPDGSGLDVNGRISNGVVYICRAGDLLSLRAVSMFGATGRLKGWRLTKTGVTYTWVKY